LKFIRTPSDIFLLDYNKIEKLEGWGKQSVKNLENAINKSKTILEGPINKIKNDFQEEKYEVILDSEVKFKSEKFDVLHNNKNKYQIRLNSQSEIRDVLNSLNKNHNIISFKKKLASIEDIFIKSVAK